MIGIRHAGAALLALSALTTTGQQPSAEQQARRREQAAAQSAAAQSALITHLNALGQTQLRARVHKVNLINSRADAEGRQAEVRRRIAELVGGVPRATGPVVPKRFGTVDEDGFRIENIAYESVPGYWVTANVYVPSGAGPFPAMVIAPGHGAGKASQFNWAANLARAGFLTLAFDPMGQGERLQHFDAELGGSKVESIGEHEHANQTALLIGQHVARYWFADGVRSVDYLTQRKDVDAARIGTFGCSGGGTAATYLTAMDPRIRVAAVASYITSFSTLLPDRGPQDAEQTLPRFISSGLDFGDWVELAAPRPFAIVAFETDFFPIAGARETYKRAQRFYSFFGATESLQLIDGPGGHCNLGPVTPQILAFLSKHLKGAEATPASFTPLRPKDADTLTVTPTGQVSTSIGGLTLEDMARRDAPRLPPLPSSQAALETLRARLRADVRAAAGVAPDPREATTTTGVAGAERNGLRTEFVGIQSEPDLRIDGWLLLPAQGGRRPAVLWMDAAPLDDSAPRPEVDRLVQSGHVVLLLHPRGVLGEPPANPAPLALGPYMPLLLRAIVVGKTLVGMRVDDTLRAIDWLRDRPDVSGAPLTVYGSGAQGLVALHAAALDERIGRVVVENALVSYRAALAAGLHRNLSEVVIPGVLARYDVPELVAAIHPRPVAIVNSANAMGQTMPVSLVRKELSGLLEMEKRLGTPERVRLLRRAPTDPLPIE